MHEDDRFIPEDAIDLYSELTREEQDLLAELRAQPVPGGAG